MSTETKAVQHTPGPWRVVFHEVAHRKDSPLCLQECRDNGLIPVRIEHDSEAEAAKCGFAGNTELHVMTSDCVDQIIGSDNEIVASVGLDYDDPGYISDKDAPLIAGAPEMLEALEQISDIDPEGQECAARNKRGKCGCIGCIARAAIRKARGESAPKVHAAAKGESL